MENRITEDRIKDKIKSEEYQLLGKKTTICLLTTYTGFEIVGTSSCVDAENYNELIGRSLAFESAIRKLYEFEGYLLQQELYNSKKPFQKTHIKINFYCKCGSQVKSDNVKSVNECGDYIYRHTCKNCGEIYYLTKEYPMKDHRKDEFND